jgi:hypothetical protein
MAIFSNAGKAIDRIGILYQKPLFEIVPVDFINRYTKGDWPAIG